MAKLLKEMSAAADFPLNMLIRTTAVVPDEIGSCCELVLTRVFVLLALRLKCNCVR
jgi:hypothetical protein